MIQELANVIASAEGFFVEGSLPSRNNNPGDLRAAPWLENPVIVGGFWQAPDLGTGIAGILHQIALNVARGYSLRRLISVWAPPSDNNNTDQYLQDTIRRMSAQGITIDPDQPLSSYLTIIHIP